MVLDFDGRRVYSAGSPEVSHFGRVQLGNSGIVGLVCRDETNGDLFISHANSSDGKFIDPEKLPLGLIVNLFPDCPPYLTAGTKSMGRGHLVETRSYYA